MRKQIIAFGPARYYNRARYYSPQLGRFLSAELRTHRACGAKHLAPNPLRPIGYGDGLNMYAYARNTPMNFRDPSGFRSEYADAVIEEVVATASESFDPRDIALEEARDVVDDIRDEVRDTIFSSFIGGSGFSLNSPSSLAASLTGYRDSTGVFAYTGSPNSDLLQFASMGGLEHLGTKIRLRFGLRGSVSKIARPLIREDFGFSPVNFFSVVEGTIRINGSSLEVRIDMIKTANDQIPFFRSVNSLINTARIHNLQTVTINATFANPRLLLVMMKQFGSNIQTQGPNEVIVIPVPSQ